MTDGHPSWCVPSMHQGGTHQGEPVEIRQGLLAVLRQQAVGPARIALEHWDDPEAAQPAELILLDLADAALLSAVLDRLADLAGGTR